MLTHDQSTFDEPGSSCFDPRDVALSDARQWNARCQELISRYAVTRSERLGPPSFGIPIRFDGIPRVIDATTWALLERGLLQRATALNHFLRDIYTDGAIYETGLIAREDVEASPHFFPLALECNGGLPPTARIWGMDIVRTAIDTIAVIEDNVRSPGLLSFVAITRWLSTGAGAMSESLQHRFHRVEPLGGALTRCLSAPARAWSDDPLVVMLTTTSEEGGNFYEHTVFSHQTGIPMVCPQDLFVSADVLYLRTTRGPRRVDVVYRRCQESAVDPEQFGTTSPVGVAGLVRVLRAGNCRLVNPLGSGIANDKALYAHVPGLIRFYLNEEPILANVPTWWTGDRTSREFVLASLAAMVTKPRDANGGKGVIIGPYARPDELAKRGLEIRSNPDAFVAQTVQRMSLVRWFDGDAMQRRHADLRAFVLFDDGPRGIVPRAAVTRVAADGGLMTNISRGAGMKDTWIEAV